MRVPRRQQGKKPAPCLFAIAEDQPAAVREIERRGKALVFFLAGVEVHAYIVRAKDLFDFLAEPSLPAEAIPALRTLPDKDGQRFSLFLAGLIGNAVVVKPFRSRRYDGGLGGIRREGEKQ